MFPYKKYIIIFHKYKYQILTSVACFFLGVTVLLVKRNWLIVHWVPSYARSDASVSVSNKHVVHRKKITMYYWKDDTLKQEEDSCIWGAGKAEDLKLLVGNWLLFLYEERILGKRVSLQSVALNASEQEAFLSFDHAPFSRDWSIHKKWQVLDGLCRTIKGLELEIQLVLFLVNHEIMSDDHLDFSQPWPIGGFKIQT